MRFSVEKPLLIEAVNTVLRALPTKSPNPILEGIYIQATDKLRLMCSNATLQIETVVQADTQEPGEYVLPGRLFAEILRKMPDGNIVIDVRPEDGVSVATITNRGSKSQLQCMSAEEFPEMPSFVETFNVRIPATKLRDMIKKTIFAVAADESRPILTGINFEVSNDNLKLVALDGYRLAMFFHSCQNDRTGSAVVPASSLKEIESTLSDSDEPILVSFNRTNCHIDSGETRINTVLLNGEYMKYDQIIPNNYNTTVRINTKEFFDASERASLMAREGKNNLIKLELQHDRVLVTSNSQIGNVREEVNITLMGNELDIAFNSKYLSDVLKVIEDDEIFLKLNSSIAPCLVEPVQGKEFLYLVLPVRMFVK